MSVYLSMVCKSSAGPLENQWLREQLANVTGRNWKEGDTDLELETKGLYELETSDLSYSLIPFKNLVTVDCSSDWASFYGSPDRRKEHLLFFGQVANFVGDGSIIVHPDIWALPSELINKPGFTFQQMVKELSTHYARERSFHRGDELYERDSPIDANFYYQMRVDKNGDVLSL